MQISRWQSNLITLTAALEVKNPFLDVELVGDWLPFAPAGRFASADGR